MEKDRKNVGFIAEDIGVDHIRVRPKIHSGFFGNILRDGNRKLSQLKVVSKSSIVF